MNRILDFEVDPGDIYQDGNRVVNILSENYGIAGQLFVKAVEEIGTEKLRATVRKYHQKIKDFAEQLGEEKEEKQIAPLAIMLTADLISEQVIFQDGVRLDFEWCMRSVKSRKQVSETERAYNRFIDSYFMNQARFDDSYDNHGEVWGKKMSGDYVAIIPSALDKIAQKYNFDTRQFIKWCKEEDLLSCDAGRMQKQVVLGGDNGRKWCYVIRLDESARNRLLIKGEVDSGPEEELPFEAYSGVL